MIWKFFCNGIANLWNSLLQNWAQKPHYAMVGYTVLCFCLVTLRSPSRPPVSFSHTSVKSRRNDFAKCERRFTVNDRYCVHVTAQCFAASTIRNIFGRMADTLCGRPCYLEVAFTLLLLCWYFLAEHSRAFCRAGCWCSQKGLKGVALLWRISWNTSQTIVACWRATVTKQPNTDHQLVVSEYCTVDITQSKKKTKKYRFLWHRLTRLNM